MAVLYLSDEAKALQSLPMALQESSCDVGLARPSQVGGIMWKPRERAAIVFGRALLDGEGALPVELKHASVEEGWARYNVVFNGLA